MKTNIPQILTTGSSGFLGQHLLHSLIKEPLLQSTQECHIHALCGSKAEDLLEAIKSIAIDSKITMEIHKLDLTDTAKVQSWISSNAAKIDVSIHMAAMSSPRTCQDDSDLARALNIPEALFQGLMQEKVPIIALSTDQVYDGANAPYTETDAVKPVNIYGSTKVGMEECLLQLSQQHSAPAILLRSSIILGPKAPFLPDKAHSTFLHFCQGREGQKTEFYSDECRSVIAVDNVVNVIRWFVSQLILQSATDKDKMSSGVYNMGGPEKVSRVDMAQAVFRHFGFSKDYLVISEKAKLPPQGMPSPLDITMDSNKLYQLVKEEIQWKGLKETVAWTFST